MNGFPWPPPPGASAAAALVETWRRSVLRPASFFEAMPETASTRAALTYYLIVGVLAAGIDLFWRSAMDVAGGAGGDPVLEAIGIAEPGLWPVMLFLLSPLLLLFRIALASAVVHALLALAGGAHASLATTARVLAYSYSPQLFGIVPVVGDIVGFAWMVVLAIIGVRSAHRTDAWRAGVAVLVPVCVAILVFLIGLLLLGLLESRVSLGTN